MDLETLPHLSGLSPLAHLSKLERNAVFPRSKTLVGMTPLIEVSGRLITRKNIEHAVDVLISFSLPRTMQLIEQERSNKVTLPVYSRT